ncbi:MAG: M20/M25/M40 family metallo-hydrolase, partial [Spirochaetaceae bacterium]
RGLIVGLTGARSHAAHPERGRSPSSCVARALLAIEELAAGVATIDAATHAGAARPAATITAVHARLGEPGFGTSPGDAVVMATLRGFDPDAVDRMEHALIARITADADAHGITVSVDHDEVFPATVNDPAAVAMLLDAAATAGIPATEAETPFRWSEDFGHISAVVPSAYCCVGAGVDHPDLHTPDYDFPDALLPVGSRLFGALIRSLCG